MMASVEDRALRPGPAEARRNAATCMVILAAAILLLIIWTDPVQSEIRFAL